MAAIDMAIASLFLGNDAHKRVATAETALIKALALAPQHALAHIFLGTVRLFRTMRLRELLNVSTRWL